MSIEEQPEVLIATAPARRRRRLWLAVTLASVLVIAAVVVLILHTGTGPSPAAAPGPFEAAARPVPCPGHPQARCFPVGDIEQNVVKPLTATGYRCVPDSTAEICGPPDRSILIDIHPTSVVVLIAAFTHPPDADTGLRQITTALQAVLPLLLPKSPNAQQSFLQWLQNAAARPNGCRLIVRDNNGYAQICQGHPAPAGAQSATTVIRVAIGVPPNVF